MKKKNRRDPYCKFVQKIESTIVQYSVQRLYPDLCWQHVLWRCLVQFVHPIGPLDGLFCTVQLTVQCTVYTITSIPGLCCPHELGRCLAQFGHPVWSPWRALLYFILTVQCSTMYTITFIPGLCCPHVLGRCLVQFVHPVGPPGGLCSAGDHQAVTPSKENSILLENHFKKVSLKLILCSNIINLSKSFFSIKFANIYFPLFLRNIYYFLNFFILLVPSKMIISNFQRHPKISLFTKLAIRYAHASEPFTKAWAGNKNPGGAV